MRLSERAKKLQEPVPLTWEQELAIQELKIKFDLDESGRPRLQPWMMKFLGQTEGSSLSQSQQYSHIFAKHEAQSELREIRSAGLEAKDSTPFITDTKINSKDKEAAVSAFADKPYRTIDEEMENRFPDKYEPYEINDIANELIRPGEPIKRVYDRVLNNAKTLLRKELIKDASADNSLWFNGVDARKIARQVEKYLLQKNKNSQEAHQKPTINPLIRKPP